MNIPEILSPAGDFERLKAAIQYGADAVYLAGKQYGMRAASPNFDREELVQAVDYAHQRGAQVYLTCNTLPRNHDLPDLPDFIQYAAQAGVDACIVNDIGLFMLIREYAPQMALHVSTQAGIVNYQTARAFYQLGAKRIVLARELSLTEIEQIRKNIPNDMEIEAFVHGAMCMAFSGRCLISDYLTHRDANRGQCAQPCRWGYALVQQNRPDQSYPIVEDAQGTYILNAQDLCMIEYIDKLAQIGVSSFKIEGRAKSAYYVAVITNAYRQAVDHYHRNPSAFSLPAWLWEEVQKVSHRPYSTGFYFDKPDQCYENGGYIRNYDVVAMISHTANGTIHCVQKNKCQQGDVVEIIAPGQVPVVQTIHNLCDGSGVPIPSTPHAQMKFSFSGEGDFPAGSFVRKATAR